MRRVALQGSRNTNSRIAKKTMNALVLQCMHFRLVRHCSVAFFSKGVWMLQLVPRFSTVFSALVGLHLAKRNTSYGTSQLSYKLTQQMIFSFMN